MANPIEDRERVEFIDFGSEGGGIRLGEGFSTGTESREVAKHTLKDTGCDNRAVGQGAGEAPLKNLSYAAVCSGAAETKQNEELTVSLPKALPASSSPEKLNEQLLQSNALFQRHSGSEPKTNSSAEDMLNGRGSWKPIEVNNMRAAKRALKNSLGSR